MSETGRHFKRSFKSTPPQAQVMLTEPFGNDHAPQRTVWYRASTFEQICIFAIISFICGLFIFTMTNSRNAI
jgi:hypothetical protein